MTIEVSVVVPTFNRPELLQSCLASLLKQDFEPGAYEIVVVDNAGSAKARQLVQSYSEKHQAVDAGSRAGFHPAIYYLEEVERPGPAAARNLGWKFAHGQVIAFTDDDCLPDSRWLAEGVKRLREGYDAVTGRVIVPTAGTPSDYDQNMARLETAEFVTANCFFRCTALQTTGGFDERFTTAWREDSDLHLRLLSMSLKLGRASQAVVVHPVRPAAWGISVKEQRKSMFNALLFKKYPALYRERIQRYPPLTYYAIVFSAISLIVSLLARESYPAVLSGVAWAALTAQFVIQRLRGSKHTLSHVAEMIVTSILIPPLSVYWRLYGAVKYRVWFL